ncbi:MAG: DUF4430 domain-containing protein [Eubacteriales bacterium]|jgi:hypothetical protein
MSSATKKNLIIVAVLIILIAGAILAYVHFSAKPVEGEKTITVDVVHKDGSTKSFTIKTTEEFLRGALEQENLIKGTDSEFGLFVETVDGETVDATKQEWWCFTQNDESLMTGADVTPIKDGDHYEIIFTVGW